MCLARLLLSGSGPQPSFTFNGAQNNGVPNNRIDGYSYDAAGNLLNDGINSYSYDAENRLISVNSGATMYNYDALDRRVAKNIGGSATDFIYDREGNVILTAPATPTAIEVNVRGLHLGTYVLNSAHTDTIFYYDHSDWLGTERARTNLSGTACETIASLPFGDAQSIASTCGDVSPKHFTGKERDTESGNDYFGARYYGGWPTLSDFCVHHFQRGCPILALFARVGGDAACAIGSVTTRQKSTNLRRHSRLPPFAKIAKERGTHSVGDASEIKSPGHPPKKNKTSLRRVKCFYLTSPLL